MSENREDLRHEAEDVGLRNLSEKHLAQFAKAKAAAARMRTGIRHDLHMVDEPAHVFRASEEA